MGSVNGPVLPWVDPKIEGCTGLEGLRVVDALDHADPLIGGNTNAPTIMIGEEGPPT